MEFVDQLEKHVGLLRESVENGLGKMVESAFQVLGNAIGPENGRVLRCPVECPFDIDSADPGIASTGLSIHLRAG